MGLRRGDWLQFRRKPTIFCLLRVVSAIWPWFPSATQWANRLLWWLGVSDRVLHRFSCSVWDCENIESSMAQRDFQSTTKIEFRNLHIPSSFHNSTTAPAMTTTSLFVVAPSNKRRALSPHASNDNPSLVASINPALSSSVTTDEFACAQGALPMWKSDGSFPNYAVSRSSGGSLCHRHRRQRWLQRPFNLFVWRHAPQRWYMETMAVSLLLLSDHPLNSNWSHATDARNPRNTSATHVIVYVRLMPHRAPTLLTWLRNWIKPRVAWHCRWSQFMLLYSSAGKSKRLIFKVISVNVPHSLSINFYLQWW